jgi:hypothetical protein
MSPAPGEKIVLTKEELQDPKIDDQLALLKNSGPTAVQPIEEKAGFRLFYSTWFYLMLAGLVGAVTGWGIIEPFFNDGIVFTGRVTRIYGEDEPGTGEDKVHKIEVSNIPVYVVRNKTSIRGGPGGVVNFSVDELGVDTVLKLRGEKFSAPVVSEFGSVSRTDAIAAEAIVVEPSGTPILAQINLSELAARQQFAGLALFPVVAGMIGLFVGAIEGIVCRTLKRALRCALMGLAAGVVGGFISILAGEVVYGFLGQLSSDPTASAGAFVIQMLRRGVAWLVAGTAMGLGQGLALKSKRLLFNGFIGGIFGGLIGGLLFDPISIMFSSRPLISGAELSRFIGFLTIGATVGLMIGLTDLITRSSWLKVVAGPLRGKEFNFYQTPIRLGSSPKDEIYLFKDSKIEPVHATINQLRDTYVIEDNGTSSGTTVNGQRIRSWRLVEGDRIRIGDSEFVYATREKK